MFSDIVKAQQGKRKKSKMLVLPKGEKVADKNPTLEEWINETAPSDWQKEVAAAKGSYLAFSKK
ncbi:MAG: hypothetical protein HQL69_19685 [Magnetococcales bacterium]|nr:hypothetical protein [Magnetococcales bacterium]